MQEWEAHSNTENLQSSISYTKPQHKPKDPGKTTDPESGDGPDGTGPTVLDQRPWDDLQGAGDGTVGPLVNPGDGLGFLIQGLHRTPTLIMDMETLIQGLHRTPTLIMDMETLIQGLHRTPTLIMDMETLIQGLHRTPTLNMDMETLIQGLHRTPTLIMDMETLIQGLHRTPTLIMDMETLIQGLHRTPTLIMDMETLIQGLHRTPTLIMDMETLNGFLIQGLHRTPTLIMDMETLNGFLIQGLHRTPTLIMDMETLNGFLIQGLHRTPTLIMDMETLNGFPDIHSHTFRKLLPRCTINTAKLAVNMHHWRQNAAESLRQQNSPNPQTSSTNSPKCRTASDKRPRQRDPVTSSKFPQTYLSHGHLRCPTPRAEVGVDHDVASNVHGILQIALHLWQDVLAGPPQQDGARLGVLALHQECEVPAHTHTHTHSCQATQQQKKGKTPAHTQIYQATKERQGTSTRTQRPQAGL